MSRTRGILLIVVLAVLLAPIRPMPTEASSAGSMDLAGLTGTFVPNVGQAHADVLFEGGVIGRVVSVTSGGLVFGGGEHLVFTGTSGAERVRGVHLTSTVTNFLLGDDPTGWRSGVPNYGAVRYENIYPGIDIEVALGRGEIVADVRALPSADRAQVGWQVVSASGLLMAESETDGAALGVETATRLVLRPDGAVDRVANHVYPAAHTEAEFKVDFATYLGGGRDDSAAAVALDGIGSAYVTGTTQSTNFPTKNAFQEEIASGSVADAFVAKIDRTGDALVYSTYLGGNRADHARDIVVLSAIGGTAAVVGYTASRDFPTASAMQEAYGGGDSDGFISILSVDGSTLSYGSFLGGRDADHAQGLSTGAPGTAQRQIYVAGSTKSTDFPLKNAFQPRLAGAEDAFLAAINEARSEFLFSTFLGGSGVDVASDVAVDTTGAAYVTGYTESGRFPTKDPVQGNVKGDFDVFVTKMAVDGSDLAYSTYLGGRDLDEGLSIDVHGDEAIVVGYTASTNFPRHEAYQPQLKGSGDGFVTRVLGDGSAWRYSTFLGGTGVDRLHSVAAGPGGVAHVAGSSESPNFPTHDAVQSRLNGPMDAVVASLSEDGQDLLFGSYFGGSRGDAAYGIAGQDPGQLAIAGYTESSDLPTSGGVQPDYAGQGDAFVARFTSASGPTPTPMPTPGSSCAIHPDAGPRQCPDGFAYPGFNGGFEIAATGNEQIPADWYNLFDARRATVPKPVSAGSYSLDLNPGERMIVPNGTISHGIDLSRTGAPQTATFSTMLWWDGNGEVKLTAQIANLPPHTLVDTSANPVAPNTWQNVFVLLDRQALTGTQPIILRWQITGGALVFLDDVDVNFCCEQADATATATSTIHPTITPSYTPTLTATPTSSPTDEPPRPTIYLPYLSKP